ncbi:MAG: glycosyl hydrolase family 98 [Akkermansiaceae bacterium]|nr:glycosyl hydrolase family 98 [Akkermansiaceae bacterium]
MRILLLLGVLAVHNLPAAPLEEEAAATVKAARAILDPWHGDHGQAGVRQLHLVYWHTNDREPCAGYEARLTRIMEHIRAFYADEMQRLGFGPRTFNLDYDTNGKLLIHLVEGAGPFADYEVQSGGKIRQECVPVLEAAGLDPSRETILIFTNLSDWDPEKLVFKHKSPYYAGGSHRQGTAWQLDSPELDTLHLPKKEPVIRDGQYGRISLGKHNSIFIGGIAHELGHALGLPHNKERPDEREAFGTALMGSGNRTYGDETRGEGKGSFLTLAHGLRLASHPQFSGSVKGMNQPASADLANFEVKVVDGGFDFSGTVEATPPVYAIIGYCDPEGSSDYNATTATAVPDENGNFTLRCRGLAKGKAAALRLVACHVNGAANSYNTARSKYVFPYSVAKDGTIDLSAMQQRFALAPLVMALKARDRAGAEDAFDSLYDRAPDGPGGATERIGRRLVAALLGERKLTNPSAVAGADSWPLSDARPAEQKVGWGRPAYDFLPGPSLLLESGGRLWEHGIYAHAPARHVYDLGGRWKTLSGSCGLAEGHGGSVVFVVSADGKELWRSKTLKPGTVADYEIDVTGAGKLELRTGDAGDGTGADWGVWLEPVLER